MASSESYVKRSLVRLVVNVPPPASAKTKASLRFQYYGVITKDVLRWKQPGSRKQAVWALRGRIREEQLFKLLGAQKTVSEFLILDNELFTLLEVSFFF